MILMISLGKIPVSGIAKSKGMNAFKALVLLCQTASHKVVPLMLEEISTKKKNCSVEESDSKAGGFSFCLLEPLPVFMF